MTVLIVIPARGGSKGIPRKNLLPLGGKPLIAWTIAQALEAGDDVYVAVSTEDEEIAKVARQYGANVIERPAELAEDKTPTEPVILHAMDTVEAMGMELEAVVLLQATSPVRKLDTIRNAIAQFRDDEADSLVGVVPESPFFWRPPSAPGESATATYDFSNRPLRQNLTAEDMFYFEPGSLYVTKPEIYREKHNRLGGKIAMYVLEEVEGVDIDTVADVAAAEKMLARIGWKLS